MQALYPSARDAFANKEIDWNSDAFTVYSLDNTYTYSALHVYVSSLTGITGEVALSGLTITSGGICSASTSSIPVSSGDSTTRLVIAVETGTPASDKLIYFTDQYTNGQPILRVSDGNNTVVQWDPSLGIFTI